MIKTGNIYTLLGIILMMPLCLFPQKLTSKKYEDSLLLSLKNASTPQKKLHSLVDLGMLYIRKADTSSFKTFYEQARQMIKDTATDWFEYSRLRIPNAYYRFKQNADLDACEREIMKSIHCFETLKKHQETGDACIGIGIMFKKKFVYMKAAQWYYKALKFYELSGDAVGQGNVLHNLGNIYDLRDEAKTSVSFHQRALRIRQKIGDREGVALSLFGTGLSWSNKSGNKDSAEKYYLLAIDLLEKEQLNERLLAQSLSAYGILLADREKYQEALPYAEKALHLRLAQGDSDAIYSSYVNYGTLKVRLKESATGLRYCNRVYDYGQREKDIFVQLSACNCLDMYYEQVGNYRKAYFFQGESQRLRDELKSNESTAELARKEAEYNYIRRAEQDSVKNEEYKKVKEAELVAERATRKQERIQFWFLLGGLLLVAGGLVFIVNRFRITNRQKQIIEQQKKEVDQAYERLNEKNKEVLDSIHYAKRIQKALITSEQYIQRSLEKHRKKS